MAIKHLVPHAPIKTSTGLVVTQRHFIESLLWHSEFSKPKGIEARKGILASLDNYDKSQQTPDPDLSISFDGADHKILCFVAEYPEYYNPKIGDFKEGYAYGPHVIAELMPLKESILKASIEKPQKVYPKVAKVESDANPELDAAPRRDVEAG